MGRGNWILPTLSDRPPSPKRNLPHRFASYRPLSVCVVRPCQSHPNTFSCLHACRARARAFGGPEPGAHHTKRPAGRFGANGTDCMTGVSGMTCKKSRYDVNRRARSRPARTLDIWRYIYIFIFHIDGGVAKTTRGQGVKELVVVGCGVRWNGGVCVCVVCTVCVVCGCGCRVSCEVHVCVFACVCLCICP